MFLFQLVTLKSRCFIKAKAACVNVCIRAMTNLFVAIKSIALKVAKAAAAQVKVRPVPMVKAAMISYSKFPKMNTSIFCLKIWRCRISRKTKLTKSPNGKPIAQVFKPRGFPPIFQWCVHCNNL
ncbi:Uncharacterised protein [Vibrio cholerae]|nr:Uncharacterised protein [Vibrio cholerae]